LRLHDFSTIPNQFEIIGQLKAPTAFGSGHIHDTYRLVNTEKAKPDYLLQRFNHTIFHNVQAVHENINLATHHLRQKQAMGFHQQTLQLIPTHQDQLTYHGPDGTVWRMFLFIKNSRSYDQVPTPELAYTGGRAFGQWLTQLADLPHEQLQVTIPDFHHLPHRLHQLAQAREAAHALPQRIAATQDDWKWIQANRHHFDPIYQAIDHGQIPMRITHNDTKFNNLLFDQQDRAVCVVDLDTVMPGIMHYDLGDGLRTATNTAAEDESDLQLVTVDREKYEAYVSGYLEAVRPVIRTEELKTLSLAAPLLAFLIGIRFLTDYWLGDSYFKTKFEEQNLHRARCQLAFAKTLLAQQPDLEAIIKKHA
jgi:hypothetical protein